MAARLEGKRIALTGPRRSQELSKLVENLGGTALVRPAQGTVFLDDEALRIGIDACLQEKPDWMVFTTGVGLEAIYKAAEDMGKIDAFNQLLHHTKLAARGYKTVNTLKQKGLIPLVRDDDGSTEGLIRVWSDHDLQDKHVIVQLHGDPAPRLMAWLKEKGASYRELLPYRHEAPPEDQLEQLLDDILNERVDAVTFTSAPQVRFLLQYAENKGYLDQLLETLRDPVVAVAVGKITAQGLREIGLQRVVAPQTERMGSMIIELAHYYAGESAAEASEDEETQN